MNTFENNFIDFKPFFEKILKWHPVYIVPVAKKACKLIKTVKLDPSMVDTESVLRYRSFFQLTNMPLSGQKIAVIDDATQYTSTLAEYRKYFENQGAIVRTFSFVGHEDLASGKRPKEDYQAEIEKFLPGPVYNEYILQQSYHLLNSGCHFDLDHYVFEASLSLDRYDAFQELLVENGTLIHVDDYGATEGIDRFSLHYPRFFGQIPYFKSENIKLGEIIKIKFAYHKNKNRLYFSPLIFPAWEYRAEKTGAGLIANIPFKLPFTVPEILDARDRSSVLRVYNDINYIASICLAKAFIVIAGGAMKDVELLINDLSALIGNMEAQEVAKSASSYLTGYNTCSFGHASIVQTKNKLCRYKSFADIYDRLKTGYENKVVTRKHRSGSHYFLSYETLFKSFGDAVDLSHKLDVFCDLGSIVPDMMMNKSRICRGCRTGEANPDESWERTDALVGLVIKAICDLFRCKVVEPTLLNKVLANLAFDYPRQDYTQLHCLEPVPYYYGSFMHLKHPLRCPEAKNLYGVAENAKYFGWDSMKKGFIGKNDKQMVRKVGQLFDQRQQAGYTEILNYIKMLAEIAKNSTSVDVMNALAICRDQEVFFTHIDFNIRQSYASFLDYRHGPSKGLGLLAIALDNAESAAAKCKMAKEMPRFMEMIEGKYSGSMEYTLSARKICEHYVEFSSEFFSMMSKIKGIVDLERLLCNLCYWSDTGDYKYYERMRELDIGREIETRKIVGTRSEILQSKDVVQKLIGDLMRDIERSLNELPRPRSGYRSRILSSARESAKNQAVSVIKDAGYKEGVFIYIDLTGMRKIEESQEDILGAYYLIVKENVNNHGGRILYGGSGGDDAFGAFFADVGPAILCAMEIKGEFFENVFLNNGTYDVKFGLAWGDFSGDVIAKKVIGAWGEAKDCCSIKHAEYVNRGELIVSDKTLDAFMENRYPNAAREFLEIPGVTLENGRRLYRHSKIRALREMK